jgi:excisionase family DNA binding protein
MDVSQDSLNTPSQTELLTTSEAALYLGVTKRTLAAWRSIKRYSIPHIKVGRLVRYRYSDLDEWLISRTVSMPHKEGDYE